MTEGHQPEPKNSILRNNTGFLAELWRQTPTIRSVKVRPRTRKSVETFVIRVPGHLVEGTFGGGEAIWLQDACLASQISFLITYNLP